MVTNEQFATALRAALPSAHVSVESGEDDDLWAGGVRAVAVLLDGRLQIDLGVSVGSPSEYEAEISWMSPTPLLDGDDRFLGMTGWSPLGGSADAVVTSVLREIEAHTLETAQTLLEDFPPDPTVSERADLLKAIASDWRNAYVA